MSELRIENALEANSFLNILFDNLNSAIFIVDQEARVRQVNQVFEKIFARSEPEVAGELCGNAIGCIFPLSSGRDCGTLKECRSCLIRGAIVKALNEKVATNGQLLSRSFIIAGETIRKHLLISVKYISYNQREMVVIIVDDITDQENHKRLLEERRRMLEKDLEAAAGIQYSLLPAAAPGGRDFSCAWHFKPCESIGGDIFNLIDGERRRLIGYLVDVSGHGVPAALVTVSLTQFIRHYLGRISPAEEFSPRQLLEQLDREYPYERFKAYFTMVCFLLDGENQRLVMANAGHPYPILLGQAQDRNLRQIEESA
ncbi:MAG: SpoIIE family protein phosphatase, partial [Deltaproteobacteria bacterium]|nr:SpoIIE family protein phosphatase [Deltaproteobacteria bacterium]